MTRSTRAGPKTGPSATIYSGNTFRPVAFTLQHILHPDRREDVTNDSVISEDYMQRISGALISQQSNAIQLSRQTTAAIAPPIIRVEHLVKRYKREETNAVDD